MKFSGLSIPQGLDPELRQYLERMAEAVEIVGGVRGNPLDRAATISELKSAGVIDVAIRNRFAIVSAPPEATVAAASDTREPASTVSGGLGSLDIAEIDALLGEMLVGLEHTDLTGLEVDDHLQYHTDDRALTWLGTRSTTDLAEGTNLYHTLPRVDAAIDARVTKLFVDALAVDHGSLTGLADDDHTQYHTDARALTWLGTRSTTDLAEGTNLYYTDGRVSALVTKPFVDALNVDADTLDGLDSLAFALAGHNHAGVYEPVLGNPLVDGYVLSSTALGVRSWVAQPVVITDHGGLGGLADDDHTQYHTDARGDARYVHLTGDQTVAGLKTFSGGAVIGQHTLGVASGSGHMNLRSATTSASGIGLRTSDNVLRGYLNANSSNQIGFLSDAGAWTVRFSATGEMEAGSVPWARLTSVPATFAPSAHVHAIADVTGLQAALDGKEPGLGNPLVDGYVLSSTALGVRSWVAMGGGSSDHGALTGLADDDHTQYHTDARGDARYLTLTGGTVTGPVTLQTDAFGASEVKRNHASFGAALKYSNLGGTMGYIGFQINGFTITDAALTTRWQIDNAGSLAVGSVPWARLTGVPATFPPDAHTHDYLPLTGGELTGPVKMGTSFRGVVSSTNNATTSSLKITTTIPADDDEMMNLTIHGYAYGAQKPFTWNVVGYNYNVSDFINVGYTAIGDFRPTLVQWAVEGGFVVLYIEHPSTYYKTVTVDAYTSRLGTLAKYQGWTVAHGVALVGATQTTAVTDKTGLLPTSGGTMTGSLAVNGFVEATDGTSDKAKLNFAGLEMTRSAAYVQNTHASGNIYHQTNGIWSFRRTSDATTRMTLNAANGDLWVGRDITAVGSISEGGTALASKYLALSGGVVTGALSARELGVSNTGNTSGKGISLYGGAQVGAPSYGIMFQGTATFGAHGAISTNDWATYFRMAAGGFTRGWIFSQGTNSHVASIDINGNAVFNGTIKEGGTALSSKYAASAHTHDANEVTVLGNYLNVQSDGKVAVNNSGSGRRAGMYGVYSSTQIGHIWSMGNSYHIDTNGATFGNLYGLAYKHTNNTTGGTMAGGHQMVWCINGVTKAALGDSGIWSAGNVTAYSDIRVKENIETIPGALETVNLMRGVYFTRKDDETQRRHTGVIAQEIQLVLPEVVFGDDMLSVDYGNIVGVLIEAIKELKTEVELLKARAH